MQEGLLLQYQQTPKFKKHLSWLEVSLILEFRIPTNENDVG